MIKAIIFDFDDTLINTWRSSTRKHIKVAEMLGLRIPTVIEFGKMFGLPWEEAIRRTWPEVNIEEFKEAFVKSDLHTEFSSIPGAKETIKSFKEMGLFLGVVTSRSGDHLKGLAEKAELDFEDFDYFQTEDQNEFKKPNPRVFDHLRESLKNNGIKENQTLYVGDAIYDYQATYGTGLNFIAFLNGAWTKKEFMDEGLDEGFITKSLKELPTIIKNWEKLEQELGECITI